MDGPWEGAQNIPVTNPAMVGNFGVEAFPGTEPGPSTFGQGNYNIIPKGAADPQAAFTFIAWLAGYNNVTFTSPIDPKGGWMPASPRDRGRPRLPGVAQGQPVAERVHQADVEPVLGDAQRSPRTSRSSRRRRPRPPKTSPRRHVRRSRRWPTSTARPTASRRLARGRPWRGTTVEAGRGRHESADAPGIRLSRAGRRRSRSRQVAPDQARAAVHQPVGHRVRRVLPLPVLRDAVLQLHDASPGSGIPVFIGFANYSGLFHDAPIPDRAVQYLLLHDHSRCRSRPRRRSGWRCC